MFRTPSLLSLLILTALRRFLKMFYSSWKTVGMLVHSFSLPATCVQQVGDHQRMLPTDAAQMTSVTTWCSSVGQNLSFLGSSLVQIFMQKAVRHVKRMN